MTIHILRDRLRSIYADPRAAYFLATALVFDMALGLYGGVFNNYLHDILHITKIERGIVEFPRELPGLLIVVLVALLYRFCEITIMRIAITCSLAGITGLLFAGDMRFAAIGMIVLWSTGEHLMMPVRGSIAVHLAAPGKDGLALGAAGSAGNIGSAIGYYVVPLLFSALPLMGMSRGGLDAYRAVFVVVAIVMACALMASTAVARVTDHVQRKRLYFRRKYSRYYVLEILAGARKQVFITFAPYVLIMSYNVRPEVLASLMGVAPLANIFVSPLLGSLIDRLGYKRLVVAEAVMLFVVCLTYGFAGRLFTHSVALTVVSVTFVTDAVLFTMGMARTVFVRSLSESQDEVTSTLSTGVSINHLVSIVIAAAGGLIWARLGTETLFSMAALFMVGSFAFSLTLPNAKRAQAAEVTA